MYAPKSSLSGSSEVTDEKEEAWLSCREACRSVSQVTEVKFVIHFIFVYDLQFQSFNWPRWRQHQEY